MSLGRPASARIDDREATIFLAFDILQLAVLLYLTGGLINPFSLLLLAPVAIGATILSLTSNVALSLLTIISIGLLGLFHQPLPWRGPPPELPEIYQAGAWAGLTLTTLLVTLYGWRLAEEQRQMSAALAAAQGALEREQRMSRGRVGRGPGRAGSPLSTSAVVANEMLARSRLRPRARMSICCRRVRPLPAILARLSVDPRATCPTPTRWPCRADRVARSIRTRRHRHQFRSGPVVTAFRRRRRSRCEPVDHAGHWQHRAERRVSPPEVEIRTGGRRMVGGRGSDDGPGFRSAARDGTPFISTRQGQEGHMGLGVFIAKTLLERTGATVTFGNRRGTIGGAQVSVRWPNPVFKAT